MVQYARPADIVPLMLLPPYLVLQIIFVLWVYLCLSHVTEGRIVRLARGSLSPAPWGIKG
jgi:hypothetical protein